MKKKHPVIGISAGVGYPGEDFALRQVYVSAVLKHGGCPLILPCHDAPQLAEALPPLLDGLILSGGGDVDPLFFGEEPLPLLGKTDHERDSFELTLTRCAAAACLPILAVCRGAQVLNIAFGGDVYQDLGMMAGPLLQHEQKSPRRFASHSVEVSSPRLAALLGRGSFAVNSFHHQALRRVAPFLEVAARAKDGVIEAVYGRGQGFALGLQWHPEWLETAESERIFAAFIEAARMDIRG
ncbi:MAG: gamma-glutamyl-gamma-aminobutyrate hydrolase family protein [Clostridiales bacterium]|nr:gamma-glutamyl-gamma-aminobutyrate hydrolase family protein [Clostridiales bacterium]